MTWFRIMFDNAYTFIVNDAMKEAFLAEASANQLELRTPRAEVPDDPPAIEEIDKAFFDLGGLYYTGQPDELITDTAGFAKVEIVSDHVAHFIERFKRHMAIERRHHFANGVEQVRILSMHWVYIFTPEQAQELLDALIRIEPQATQKAREFFAKIPPLPAHPSLAVAPHPYMEP